MDPREVFLKAARDELAPAEPDATGPCVLPNITSPMRERVLSIPFDEAAILTVWRRRRATALFRRDDCGITRLKDCTFRHYIACSYSSFTYFSVSGNSGEYKLMGLGLRRRPFARGLVSKQILSEH